MPDEREPPFPTEPPPEAPPTTPTLEVIATGAAQRTVAEVFAALAEAVRRAEAVAMACARSLDPAESTPRDAP